MQVWNVCKRLTVNTGRKSRQKSASGHHRTTLSGYIFATKARIDNRKNLLSMSPQYCELRPAIAAEICWRVWGTRANFNGFRVLASLLQRRRSTEVNQTLHDVWPSPCRTGTLYIHFLGLLPRNGILPRAKFTLRPTLTFSYIGSVAAR